MFLLCSLSPLFLSFFFFKCDIDGCGRKFTTIYNLNSHKKLHERPCNEVCPKPNCNQRYPTKRQLDLHLKNHADVEKTYK